MYLHRVVVSDKTGNSKWTDSPGLWKPCSRTKLPAPVFSRMRSKMAHLWQPFFLYIYINNIIIIIIMFIDCKWVDTQQQWSFNMLHMHGLWRLII